MDIFGALQYLRLVTFSLVTAPKTKSIYSILNDSTSEPSVKKELERDN